MTSLLHGQLFFAVKRIEERSCRRRIGIHHNFYQHKFKSENHLKICIFLSLINSFALTTGARRISIEIGEILIIEFISDFNFTTRAALLSK